MKNLVLFGIFVLFLVAVQFASGQTVDEIIEKHIRAKGGFDKLDAIQNIYMEGMITLMGITSFIKIATVRNELNPVGFNQQWQLTDQEKNSAASEHIFTNTTFLSEVMSAMQTDTDIAKPLINYVAKGHTAVLIGKEVIDAVTCYKLKLTTKEGNVIYYWINKDDFLIIQSSFENSETGVVKNESILTRYNNYKVADGILFAHSIEIQINRLRGNSTVAISCSKVEINQLVESKFLNQNQYNQS